MGREISAEFLPAFLPGSLSKLLLGTTSRATARDASFSNASVTRLLMPSASL